MSKRIQDLLMKQDPLLTGIAQGYGNSAYVGTELFPVVSVPKERVRVPEYGKENLKVYKTERGLRANSNELEPEGITIHEIALDEHDLSFPMDWRETESAKEQLDLERYAAQNVTDAILLKREKLISDLTLNASNYGSGNKVTLAGNDQWNVAHADSQPITDVFTARDAVRASCGQYPNVMLLSADVYKTLQNHSTIIERLKYSTTGVVTVDLLQSIFAVDKIVVGQSIYVNPATGAFVDVWSDKVVLAHVPMNNRERRSQFVPSFGYTFQMDGFPMIDRYESPDKKVKYVRNTTLMLPKMLAAGCGYLISDVLA